MSVALGLLTYEYFSADNGNTTNGDTKPEATDLEILQEFALARDKGERYSSIVSRHTSNTASPNSNNLSLVLALMVCCGTYAFLEYQTKKA